MTKISGGLYMSIQILGVLSRFNYLNDSSDILATLFGHNRLRFNRLTRIFKLGSAAARRPAAKHAAAPPLETLVRLITYCSS